MWACGGKVLTARMLVVFLCSCILGTSGESGLPVGIISGAGAVVFIVLCIIILVLLRWSWKKNHSAYKLNNNVVLMQNPAYGTATERDYSGHHYELVECRFDDRDSVEIKPNPSYRLTRRQPQRKVDSATVKSSGVLVTQNPRCNNRNEMTSSENQYDYVIDDKVNPSQVQSNHDIESSYLSVIAD